MNRESTTGRATCRTRLEHAAALATTELVHSRLPRRLEPDRIEGSGVSEALLEVEVAAVQSIQQVTKVIIVRTEPVRGEGEPQRIGQTPTGDDPVQEPDQLPHLDQRALDSENRVPTHQLGDQRAGGRQLFDSCRFGAFWYSAVGS